MSIGGDIVSEMWEREKKQLIPHLIRATKLARELHATLIPDMATVPETELEEAVDRAVQHPINKLCAHLDQMCRVLGVPDV